MKEGHFKNEKLNWIVSKITLVLGPHPFFFSFGLFSRIYSNLPISWEIATVLQKLQMSLTRLPRKQK